MHRISRDESARHLREIEEAFVTLREDFHASHRVVTTVASSRPSLAQSQLAQTREAVMAHDGASACGDNPSPRCLCVETAHDASQLAPTGETVMARLHVETTHHRACLPFYMGTAKLLCCLLYTSPSPRDKRQSRMPSSA